MSDLEKVPDVWFMVLIALYAILHHVAIFLVKSKSYTIHAIDSSAILALSLLTIGFKLANEIEFSYIALCLLILFSMLIMWRIILRGCDGL